MNPLFHKILTRFYYKLHNLLPVVNKKAHHHMTEKKQQKSSRQSLTRRLMPSILMPGQNRMNKKMGAQWMYERLVKSIIDFEDDLDEEHEVGANLVSFNDTETFSIMDIGFWDPDLIIFFGISPEGNRIQLMQHVSQVNIMLVAMKKPEEKPARRIGFILEQKMPKQKGKKKPGRKTKPKSKKLSAE